MSNEPGSKKRGSKEERPKGSDEEKPGEQESLPASGTDAAMKSFTAHQVLKGLVDPHNPEKTPAERARERGFMDAPGVKDFVRSQARAKEGSPFAEMLPLGRRRPDTTLPETEIEPAPLLSSFEAMKDVYLKLKGRTSRRTKDLLESGALEALVDTLEKLLSDETLSRKSEARIASALFTELKDDPGPLLLGLNDRRLSEPWRLFLDGWDIWVPEGDEEGVELFWEGEGEEDGDAATEILQVLRLKGDEVELETRLGARVDCVTFDGEAFYRLRNKAKE